MMAGTSAATITCRVSGRDARQRVDHDVDADAPTGARLHPHQRERRLDAQVAVVLVVVEHGAELVGPVSRALPAVDVVLVDAAAAGGEATQRGRQAEREDARDRGSSAPSRNPQRDSINPCHACPWERGAMVAPRSGAAQSFSWGFAARRSCTPAPPGARLKERTPAVAAQLARHNGVSVSRAR